MGLVKRLEEMAKEYAKNPREQYWKTLEKMLNLHETGKVSKEEVLEFVKRWAEKK